MNDLVIPYFRFPAQVIFLDDDELFLESVKKYIISDNKLISMFSDPVRAYENYLKNDFICSNPNKFLSSVALEEVDDDTHVKARLINYSAIVNLIYDKKRFSENAVFVIDYSMPVMSGIDFFNKIKDSLAKKIMLTGYDDYKLAVRALNDRLIDRYIVKEVDEIKKGLNKQIDEMIWEYFCDLSNKVQPLSDLHVNKDFIKIFKEWLRKNSIIDFYQCDDIGSYLGLNKEGDIFWLMLTTDKQLNQFQDIALSAGLDTHLINNLKNKSHLLFLFSEKEKKQPVSEWGKYIFPVYGNFSIADEIYFYSFLNGGIFNLDKTSIVSLKDINN